MTEIEFYQFVEGKPWVNRADGPGEFDCWGLVTFSMIHIDGIKPPIVTGYKEGLPTGKAAMPELCRNHWSDSSGKDGDIVWYFDSNGMLCHVGRVMFGKILHVMSGGCRPVVKLTPKAALSSAHYRTRYVTYAPDNHQQPD